MTLWDHGEKAMFSRVDMSKTVNFLFLVFLLVSCEEKASKNPEKVLSVELQNKCSDKGFHLFGDHYFYAEGATMSTISKDWVKIVPQGAVLTAVNEEFVMGYYEGDIILESGEKLQKIFFHIKSDGVLEFGHPFQDNPRVMGALIEESVRFQ